MGLSLTGEEEENSRVGGRKKANVKLRWTTEWHHSTATAQQTRPQCTTTAEQTRRSSDDSSSISSSKRSYFYPSHRRRTGGRREELGAAGGRRKGSDSSKETTATCLVCTIRKRSVDVYGQVTRRDVKRSKAGASDEKSAVMGMWR